MKSFIHSKKFIYTLLTLIMIAGIARFSYGFFVEKKGTHSDEEWSFGLANSYYEPYIYSSDDDLYTKNNNKWISGKVIKDYLTVQKGERFSFGSVYYNMSCDMHPPLYFFVLHFLSSFFVDQYILALGFFINVICYIFFAIYIYKTLALIGRSDFFAVLGVLFCTFNNGTLSMMVYIRMYMMVTMFATMFLYYTGKLYYTPRNEITKSFYIKLAAVTCLGALTHHFFLPYAFIITACMCICWIVRKDKKMLFKYATAMIVGVSLSIALFPATIDHLTGIETFQYRDIDQYKNISSTVASIEPNQRFSQITEKTFTTDNIPNYKQIIFKYYFFTCMSLIFDDIIGFSPVSPYTNGHSAYWVVALFLLFFILCCICFLFRKEQWFLIVKRKIHNKIKQTWKSRDKIISKFNWFIFSMLLSIFFIVIICSFKVNVMGMGNYTNRYLFIIYPAFSIIILSLIYTILNFSANKINLHFQKTNKSNSKHSCKRKYNVLFLCIIILILLFNNITQSCIYYFAQKTKNSSLISKISPNSDCIIVSSSDWYLTVYSPLILNSHSVFFTSYNDFLNLKTTLEKNNSDKNIYLLLDTSYFPSAYENSASSNEPVEYSNNSLDIRKLYSEKKLDDPIYKEQTHLDFAKSLSFSNKLKYVGSSTIFSIPINIYQLR